MVIRASDGLTLHKRIGMKHYNEGNAVENSEHDTMKGTQERTVNMIQ